MSVTIEVTGQNAQLSGRITADVFRALSGTPGKWRWVGRTFHFRATEAALNFVRQAVPDATWTDGALAAMALEDAKAQAVAASAAAKRAPLLPEDVDYAFKTEPYEHQRRAWQLARDREAYAFLMEMGTGKSKATLDVAAWKYKKGEINALIVVAPNGVHLKWRDKEVPDHLPTWVPRRTGSWSSFLAGRKWQQQILDALATKTDDLVVLTINVEAFSKVTKDKSGKRNSPLLTYLRTFFKVHRKVMMVLDESTRIRNHDAERTRTLLQVRKAAVARMILTGSPVVRGVENLYSQFKFLTDNPLGCNTFTEFKAEFCVTGGYENRQVVGAKNLPELTRRLDGWSYRVTKAECLDLPPKVYDEVMAPLSPEQARLYKEVRDELVADVEAKRVTAEIAIVQLTKLHQIVCGFVRTDDGSEVVLDCPRMDICCELMEDASDQTVVWTRWRRDALELARRNKDSVLYIGGDPERNAESIRLFQAGKVRKFIGTVQGGIGFDLTAASYMIYYSNSFDAEHRWQSEDRAHRIGQTRSLTILDLYAPNTVDAKLFRMLRQRKSLATKVLDPHTIKELLDG
jgi:SNF2 family DNA or RNA helicase